MRPCKENKILYSVLYYLLYFLLDFVLYFPLYSLFRFSLYIRKGRGFSAATINMSSVLVAVCLGCFALIYNIIVRDLAEIYLEIEVGRIATNQNAI